jgi:hypothetical protein
VLGKPGGCDRAGDTCFYCVRHFFIFWESKGGNRMIWEPVSKILGETNQILKKLLTDENKIQDMEVLLRLSVVLSKNETLEEIASHMCERIKMPKTTMGKLEGTTASVHPKYGFVAEIEDDNPDKEDADVKKAREEDRGFFG